MNIFLTFDYELFFGTKTGTIEKCMLEPTQQLIDIAAKHQVPLVFFVDVGFLIALDRAIPDFPELKQQKELVANQLVKLTKNGHDLQLHIHPHWEKSYYQDGKWVIVTDGAYKLDDFPDDEIERIVRDYKNYLDKLIGVKSVAFRAGGWCIQPFSRLKKAFQENGLQIDSSVFPGGKFFSPHYAFDFSAAPAKSEWKFSDDVCQEDPTGFMTEIPIASHVYSPLFYWRLYGWGRVRPARHKMLGDGLFLAQPGRKKSVLTHFTHNHVSSDGFYASKLTACLNEAERNKQSNFVVIGHPKSTTVFSLEKLDAFIGKAKNKHEFKTFSKRK